MPVWRLSRRTCAAIAGLLVVGLVPASAVAQDLFGFLRGFNRSFQEESRERAPAYSAPIYDAPSFRPLELSVRSRRHAQGRLARRSRPVALSQEKRRNVIAAQNEAYARLNPERNPTWYLSDPTLRRGDLVVTADGITVFTGRNEASHQPSDFSPLAEAQWGSKRERQTLARMAQAPGE